MIPSMWMRRRLNRFYLIMCIGFSCFYQGCEKDRYAYYMVTDRDKNRELQKLFLLLQGENENNETRFVLVHHIADILLRASEREKQILFLTSYVMNDPEDSYNAFYLLMVAESYKELAAIPLAVHYYERILKNHPDLLVLGESIHFHCLQALLEYVKTPEYRIRYFKELVSRFRELIDLSTTYFFLGLMYEEIGEWDQAIQTFKKFLQFQETEIAGYPGAYRKVKEKVAFYNSDKSWTAPDLRTLVNEVKIALRTRNSRMLLKYRAKVNFFTRSWEQEESPFMVQGGQEFNSNDFDIGFFLSNSRIVIDSELDPESNANEAFLRTTGWHTTKWIYRIPTWYLYFRRVDYHPDPEIDGRWEWVGIYFGEKL